MDFVAERLGHANFSELQEIDLPHCDLRTIDVGNGEVFRNLRRFVMSVSLSARPSVFVSSHYMSISFQQRFPRSLCNIFVPHFLI